MGVTSGRGELDTSGQALAPDTSRAEAGLAAPVRSAFDTAVQLLEAGRASLLLRHPIEPDLYVAASVGIDPRLAASIRVPIGQGVAGLVVERGFPLFGTVRGQTFVTAPVRTEHRVEGALSVTDRRGGGAYSAEHIALASRAADHIGHLIQYERYAARDPVSGLHNRRTFEEMLQREVALAQRTGNSFAVVFMDLDNLKTINDRYGHNRGDEVIRAVGERIQRVLRPYDFAGRYGGDEFALLLAGTSDSNGAIAARLSEAIAELAEEMGLPIATSVGVARWAEDGTTPDKIMAAADARMYEHKRGKKDRGKRPFRY